MIEDFLRHHSLEDAESIALHGIYSILQENGTTCVTLGLPEPQEQGWVTAKVPQEEPADFYQLNNGQRRLVDSVLEVVHSIVREGTPQANAFISMPQGVQGRRSFSTY